MGHDDEDNRGLGEDNSGDAEDGGDGDDAAEKIHQERFWGQKGRTGDVGTEGRRGRG